MKLSNLHIERFGARTDLNLAEFTDHLNVIYGPNGAGKTTIIQFIKWMLFGARDERSRRYLNTSSGPACGRMTIQDMHGVRTLERHSQSGITASQLSVQGHPSRHAGTPAIGVSSNAFDHFFVVSFDQQRSVTDLLNAAQRDGLSLHIDQRRIEEAHRLRQQIEQQRSELQRYGYLETLAQLNRSKDEKRREIERARVESARRADDLQTRRNQLCAELGEPQMQVDRLRSVVANIAQALETRKRQLADEHQSWAAEKQNLVERRNRRIAEIEGQLNRWQTILGEVRNRLEQLRSRISSFANMHASADDTPNVQLFMRQLGFRMRDIEDDLSNVYTTETWKDHEADADYMRSLLSSAVRAMQSDIARLGKTAERQQHVNELHETREELNYLCRVEQELADLTEALNRQRHQLGRESLLSPNSSSLHYDSLNALPFSDGLYPSSEPLNTYHPTNYQNDFQSEFPDFRLQHLTERHHTATNRLRQAESEIFGLQQALKNVDEELSRIHGVDRIQHLEREIVEIDTKIGQRERRSQIERSIAAIEDQLRHINEHAGSSQIVDNASNYLSRLTDGEFVRIEISQDQRCRIIGQARSPLDAHGRLANASHAYEFSQLSRGSQDQVYLSLVIAVAQAFKIKDGSVPMILNDVFGNLDQSGTRALAQLLSEFSAQGQQIFVFTRHDHIKDIFVGTQSRIFTLREGHRAVVDTPAPPLPLPSVERKARPIYDSAQAQTLPPTPSYKWVAEWQTSPARDTGEVFSPSYTSLDAPEIADEWESRSYPSLVTETSSPASEVPRTNVETLDKVLVLASSLQDASLLGDEFVGYMNRLGINRVDEFLELDPQQAEAQLQPHGITAEIVQRRQREVTMVVYVDATEREAKLLVACGVPDPARLARADEAVLLKRVETVLRRPQAIDRFGAISKYGIERVRNWIQSAQRSNFTGRSRRTFPTSQRATVSQRATTERSSRRIEKETVRMPSNGELRFYLEPNDPVVDAPSIGPKTAEKLNAVDVFTVAQLLNSDPADIAARLNEKRFSATVIEQWQLQARLVCCIPNLRGHDAQILVGCGVEDPITLASLDPSNFLKKVTRFVDSKEGQRAIRNAKKPDLAEVTAWIQWSESARQLRAA